MPFTMVPLVDDPTALDNLGSVLTTVWSWITNGLSTITGNPILLIGLGIFTAGAIIGLVYRLIRG